MSQNNVTKSPLKSKTHELNSSIRFLKNLHEEIRLSSDIKEIQDKKILEKFEQVICFLENEFSNKK